MKPIKINGLKIVNFKGLATAEKQVAFARVGYMQNVNRLALLKVYYIKKDLEWK